MLSISNYQPTPEQLAGIAQEDAKRTLLCKQVQADHKAKQAEKLNQKLKPKK